MQQQSQQVKQQLPVVVVKVYFVVVGYL